MPQKLFVISKINIFILLLIFIYLTAIAFANASSQKPDLIVRVIDQQQGLVAVKNVGKIKSKSTQLYVICTRIFEGVNRPCATGLNLSNYIKKWNALFYNIPALGKAKSSRIKIFSDKNIPRKPGYYAIKLIVNPLKKITESDETNNFARFDIRLKNTLIEAPGILAVIFKDESNSQPASRSYAVVSNGRKKFTSQGGITGSEPVKVSLPPGKYTLYVFQKWQQINRNPDTHFSINPILGAKTEQIFSDIRIKSDEKITKNITFKAKQTGQLNISAFLDGKPIKVGVRIFKASGNVFVFSSLPEPLPTPMQMNLLPGEYQVTINLVARQIADKNKSFPKSAYPEQSFNIKVSANKEINKTVNLKRIKFEKLIIKVLLNGSAVKAEIKVKTTDMDKRYYSKRAVKYNFFNNTIKLLPGKYDLLITPLTLHVDLPGIDVFHGHVSGPGLSYRKSKKTIELHNIQIEAGKRLKKIVRINTQ